MTSRILLVMAVAVVAAACSTAGADTVDTLPTEPGGANDAATSGLAEPGTPNPAADDGDSFVGGDGVPVAVQYATDDLARHLSVSEEVIDWVSYEQVMWSDGSLGCPQEGVANTDALAPGTLIVFEVDGVAYEYHSGENSDPFLCLDPIDPVSAAPNQ